MECPKCGHAWQSRSESGRTQCPRPPTGCGSRVYVPLAVRQAAAEGMERRQLAPSCQPSPKPAPESPVASVASTHSPPTARGTLPDRTGGITYIDAASRAVNLVAAFMGMGSPDPPETEPEIQPNPIAPSAPPSPPVPTQVTPQPEPADWSQPHPYVLEVSCGCPCWWHNTDPPAVVQCPRHGPVTVRSMHSSDAGSAPSVPLPSSISETPDYLV